MKKCFKCLQNKPLEAFYAHRGMADGYLGKCKECAKADVAQHRAANIDSIREYDRRRSQKDHRREATRYYSKLWRETFPARKKAQTAVGYALRSGRLVAQPCWVCGSKAEAHHPDYDRPLDVVWLCSPHHHQAHAAAK